MLVNNNCIAVHRIIVIKQTIIVIKTLSVFGQIDYVKYCDGKIASEESDKEIRSRLNQIYSMMKKEEENFLIYSFQTNDKIYGICNVYNQHGERITFFKDDLNYSFSFFFL